MKNIEIIPLLPSQWAKYKIIRLEALKNNPEAFATTYEEALKISDDEWKQKLEKAQNKNGNWLLFAKSDKEIVGMIWAYRESNSRVSHIVNIFWFYVHSDCRWLWVGKSLFWEMLDLLENTAWVEKMKLSVITQNTQAIELYKKFWFQIVWELKNELKSKHIYFDEYILEKIL